MGSGACTLLLLTREHCSTCSQVRGPGCFPWCTLLTGSLMVRHGRSLGSGHNTKSQDLYGGGSMALAPLGSSQFLFQRTRPLGTEP